MAAEQGERLREADLVRHLENNDAGKAAKDEKKKDDKADKKKDEPAATSRGGLPGADDYQVQEALNLLKGVSIFKVK